MGNKPTCIDGGMFGGSLPLAFLLKKPLQALLRCQGLFPFGRAFPKPILQVF